ncbi:MAG: ATP synthase F1 subunit gamma [Firmicutes bacterium]|nr:ATP synthase F1 subunit gamma [Candidatus Fiminaster equi]
MAQALNKTKRRITSVKSTKKITEAMELVATVKLKKFRNVMERNQFYVKEMENVIFHLFGALDANEEIPYLKEGKGDKDLVVVINSNLGLCASYNSNVFNFVKGNISKESSIILPIGLKGELNYNKEGYEVISDYVRMNEKLDYDATSKLGRHLHSEFLKGKYRSIKVVYTKYVNSLRFEPTLITLFPIVNKEEKQDIGYAPIYDPNVKTLIEELVPIYLVSSLYQKLIESQVSEQASRRTAMENANDNADELIDKLTIEYNKARQAAITQEILEVVAGQKK